MEKRRESIDGYFTIEATLIMCMTIACIVLLIYLGFYQYNRCLIVQDAYRLSLKGSSTQFADNDEVYQKVSTEYNQYYWKKYMAMKISNPLIEVSGTKVSVKIEGKMSIPFSVFKSWTITEDSSSKRIVPTEQIKIFRKLQIE